MSNNLTPSQKGQATALPKSSEVAVLPTQKPQNVLDVTTTATEVKSVHQVISRFKEFSKLCDMHTKATDRVNDIEEFLLVISDESGFTLTAVHTQTSEELEFTPLKGNMDFVKLQLEIGKKYLSEIEISIQNFTL